MEDEVIDWLKTKHNITLGEFYGDTKIYAGGWHISGEPQEVRQFFESSNQGNYTVHIFRIPDEFYTRTLNTEELKKVIDK